MTLLLDTQILLWAVNQPDRLPAIARTLLTEGVTLLTSDTQVARYGGPVRKV